MWGRSDLRNQVGCDVRGEVGLSVTCRTQSLPALIIFEGLVEMLLVLVAAIL